MEPFLGLWRACAEGHCDVADTSGPTWRAWEAAVRAEHPAFARALQDMRTHAAQHPQTYPPLTHAPADSCGLDLPHADEDVAWSPHALMFVRVGVLLEWLHALAYFAADAVLYDRVCAVTAGRVMWHWARESGCVCDTGYTPSAGASPAALDNDVYVSSDAMSDATTGDATTGDADTGVEASTDAAEVAADSVPNHIACAAMRDAPRRVQALVCTWLRCASVVVGCPIPAPLTFHRCGDACPAWALPAPVDRVLRAHHTLFNASHVLMNHALSGRLFVYMHLGARKHVHDWLQTESCAVSVLDAGTRDEYRAYTQAAALACVWLHRDVTSDEAWRANTWATWLSHSVPPSVRMHAAKFAAALGCVPIVRALVSSSLEAARVSYRVSSDPTAMTDALSNVVSAAAAANHLPVLQALCTCVGVCPHNWGDDFHTHVTLQAFAAVYDCIPAVVDAVAQHGNVAVCEWLARHLLPHNRDHLRYMAPTALAQGHVAILDWLLATFDATVFTGYARLWPHARATSVSHIVAAALRDPSGSALVWLERNVPRTIEVFRARCTAAANVAATDAHAVVRVHEMFPPDLRPAALDWLRTACTPMAAHVYGALRVRVARSRRLDTLAHAFDSGFLHPATPAAYMALADDAWRRCDMRVVAWAWARAGVSPAPPTPDADPARSDADPTRSDAAPAVPHPRTQVERYLRMCSCPASCETLLRVGACPVQVTLHAQTPDTVRWLMETRLDAAQRAAVAAAVVADPSTASRACEGWCAARAPLAGTKRRASTGAEGGAQGVAHGDRVTRVSALPAVAPPGCAPVRGV